MLRVLTLNKGNVDRALKELKSKFIKTKISKECQRPFRIYQTIR